MNARIFRNVGSAGLMALVFLAGCKNKEQQALETAKAQAASTNTAQQIQYIDKNGDTVTTVVPPPVQGQPQQVATTLAPPAPGPAPHSTDPVITPVDASGQPVAAPVTASDQPIAAGPTQAVARLNRLRLSRSPYPRALNWRFGSMSASA